jgi:hypothetical protein
VYFVVGHNFHVEWHLRFGVEIREKAWSMLIATIPWRPEICHLGMRIVQKWLSKIPYALYKNCRGMPDLQLSYTLFGALMLQNLELNSVKVGMSEMFWHPTL